MKRTMWMFAMCLSVLVALSWRARSASSTPSAETIVKQMLKKYQSLNTFEEIATDTRLQKRGAVQQTMTLKARFVYKKPNKFLYDIDDPYQGILAVCDGKEFYFLVRSLNQYRKHPAPASMAEVARVEPMFRTVLDPPAFLRGDDPIKGARNLKLVGSETIGRQPTYHLRFDQPPPSLPPTRTGAPPMTISRTTEMWIGKQDFLLYKTQTTIKASRGNQSVSSVMTEIHTQMKVNHDVADSVFHFTPPKGAKEVKEFFRSPLPGASPGGAPPPAQPRK
ncbi:MAG: DUF2092 domain-containing protein [Abditibacteriales bacterium]|nr:DUF2092 domain-containing protein [Abditibacteriales bacterium]MDW8364291.1 DUF2092 domain-containing protein [Abditibacteriales bacterium]